MNSCRCVRVALFQPVISGFEWHRALAGEAFPLPIEPGLAFLGSRLPLGSRLRRLRALPSAPRVFSNLGISEVASSAARTDPTVLSVTPVVLAIKTLLLPASALSRLLDQLAPLLGVEMAASDVGADDERAGILTSERAIGRLDAGGDAGAGAVGAMEDLVIEQDDGLDQTVRLYVGDQLIELDAIEATGSSNPRTGETAVRWRGYSCSPRRVRACELCCDGLHQSCLAT